MLLIILVLSVVLFAITNVFAMNKWQIGLSFVFGFIFIAYHIVRSTARSIFMVGKKDSRCMPYGKPLGHSRAENTIFE